MSRRLWIAAVFILGLTWFDSELRKAVLLDPWLFLALAISCGIGAVAMAVLGPGAKRRAAGVLLALLALAIGVGWQYLHHPAPGRLDLSVALVDGLGVTLVPVGISVFIGHGAPNPRWAFIQTWSLSFLVAPLSILVAFVLAACVRGE